jgi:hypothetical protein
MDLKVDITVYSLFSCVKNYTISFVNQIMVSLLVFYWQFDDVIKAAMTFGTDIFFFMFSVVSILEWFIGQSLELCSLS